MTSDKPQKIGILLNRYFEMKCTEKEKHTLLELLSQSCNEKLIKEILISHLNDIDEDKIEKNPVDFDKIYNQILVEIDHRETRASEKRLLHNRIKIKRLVFEGISIAAVFLIAFFIGGGFTKKHSDISTKLSSSNSPIEIRAPFGARSEVKLADGTEVTLNAGSTIKYFTDYNRLNRDLILEGEAYFKVAKNADMPFVVNAGELNIKAIGTKFNILAYQEDDRIEATLEEGEIHFSGKGNEPFRLKEGQQVVFSKNTHEILIRDVIPEIYTSWMENKLRLNNTPIEEALWKIGRKYNVTFEIVSSDLLELQYTATFTNETIEEVMNMLKSVSPISYKIFKNTRVNEKKYLKPRIIVYKRK